MSFTVNPKASSTKQARGRGRGTTEGIRGGSVINRGNRNVSRPSVHAGTTTTSSETSKNQSRSRTNTSNSQNPSPVGRTRDSNRLPTVPAFSTSTRTAQRTGVSPSRSITRASRGRGVGAAGATRGRNRLNMYDSQHDPVNQDPNNRGNSDDSTLDNRIQHTSGFTVVSPNEKKRREITEQAQRNMKTYEEYKQQSKLQHVSYVGTVGGGLISEGEARHKAAINQSQAAFNSRAKRESVRAAIRQEENASYDQKKQAARKQAELNEERRKREEERRQASMRDDMRRKNAAFLDRLQANNPSQQTSDSREASLVTKSKTTQKVSLGKSTPKVFPAKTEITTKNNSRNTPSAVTMAANSSDMTSNENHELDLNQLQVMFPDYSRNYLKEILIETGSLQVAVDILGGFD